MKKILIAGFVGILLGGVAAWFGRPVEVKEVTVEKIVVQTVREVARDVVTRKVTKTNQSGETTVEETTVDRSREAEATKGESVQVKTLTKKTLEGRTEVLAGIGLTGAGSQSYVVGIQRQFLGPISLGILATTNMEFGLRSSAVYGTVGLRF